MENALTSFFPRTPSPLEEKGNILSFHIFVFYLWRCCSTRNIDQWLISPDFSIQRGKARGDFPHCFVWPFPLLSLTLKFFLMPFVTGCLYCWYRHFDTLFSTHAGVSNISLKKNCPNLQQICLLKVLILDAQCYNQMNWVGSSLVEIQ